MRVLVNPNKINDGICCKYDSIKHRFDDKFYQMYFGMLNNDKPSRDNYDKFIYDIGADPESEVMMIEPMNCDDWVVAVVETTVNELRDKNLHNKCLYMDLRHPTGYVRLDLIVRLDTLRYDVNLDKYEDTPDKEIYVLILADNEEDGLHCCYDGVKMNIFNTKPVDDTANTDTNV